MIYRVSFVYCHGLDCSTCRKESIACIMDVNTGRRRKINRTRREFQMAGATLSDELLVALRKASESDARELYTAIRQNALLDDLKTLAERIMSHGKTNEPLSPSATTIFPVEGTRIHHTGDELRPSPESRAPFGIVNQRHFVDASDNVLLPSTITFQTAGGGALVFGASQPAH